MSIDPQAGYYDAGGIETLAVIRAKLTPEQWEGYLLGNVIKYVCRLNHKDDPASNARKLALYAKWLREAKSPDKEEGHRG